MARIAAGELLGRLAKGKPVTAMLLLGDEAYLRDSCRTLLVEKLVPAEARTWAVSRYSAERGGTQAALDQAQTMPMLSPQQVVFLEDVEAIEKMSEDSRERAVEALVSYLENPAPFTTLVLEAGSLDQRMKLGKLLAEKALVVAVGLGEDANQKRQSAVGVAQTVARDLGVTLESGAAEDLSECVGDDLARLKTELEKLAAYAGERRCVRREDVSLLVVSEKKYTVWQLAEMIAARQRRVALEFLDRLLRDGEEPVALVGAMAWMYRKLIEASEMKGPMNPWQAARQLGMRPEMADLAMQSARKIPRQRLLEGLRALQEADDRLKSGGKSPRAVMDFLVTQLTGETRHAEMPAQSLSTANP